MHMDRYGYEKSQYHNRMQIKKEISILHNSKSLRMLTHTKNMTGSMNLCDFISQNQKQRGTLILNVN